MKFHKFTIENYRGIENTEVSLRDNLIPIIGINESGKSTLLQAILSFDKNKDDYIVEGKKGEHLIFTNLHDHDFDQRNCLIKAEVSFESENEINIIADGLSLPHEDPLKNELLQVFKGANNKFTLTRTLVANTEESYYSVSGITNIPEESNHSIADKIFEQTPQIIYLSDKHLTEANFNITFPQGLTSENWKPGKSKYTEFRACLQQIFYDAAKCELKDFVQFTDEKK